MYAINLAFVINLMLFPTLTLLTIVLKSFSSENFEKFFSYLCLPGCHWSWRIVV